MFRIPVALAVLIVWFAAPAHAIVIEVPIPALNGTYGDSRTVPLVLPAAPTVIHGASFRVTGTTQVGSLTCMDTYPGRSLVWPAEVIIRAYDGSPLKSWYLDEAVSTSGPFSLQNVASPSYFATDWDFLLDGVGTVTFFGGGTPYIAMCPPSSPSPTVTVTEAVFIIDADFAIEPTTWGRIKALYR